MAIMTQTREAKKTSLTVVEAWADHPTSGDVAREHKGTLVTLESLLRLLHDHDFVTLIEGTKSYKMYGYTWLWTDTVNTGLCGPHSINPLGKTLPKMLRRLKDSNRKVPVVPPDKRAYFHDGAPLLSVHVWRPEVHGIRLSIGGVGSLDVGAPLVVVEQNLSQVKLTKAALSLLRT